MVISERRGACDRCGGAHELGVPCPRGEGGEPPRRTGEVIGGKYRLARRLGAGGMGEVYEARHTFIGRRFAIKLLLPQYARDRDMLARFQREAQAAGALESEHIAAVTDFGFAADGAPYLVMEHLEGEDLARLLARTRPVGPFDVARAVDLVAQACRGLGVAHRHGIVHRDLKPENLFVVPRSDGGDQLKLLDFGIAKLRDLAGDAPLDRGTEIGLGGGAPGELARGVTRSGAALGTPCYMSPEQARGEREIDQRADLYALGVIFYELLAGRKPHVGASYNAILFHILTQPPEPLGKLRDGLPPGLAEVVASAMAFDRDGRYASAAALADALAPFTARARAIGERSVAGPRGASGGSGDQGERGERRPPRQSPTMLTPETGQHDGMTPMTPPPPPAQSPRPSSLAATVMAPEETRTPALTPGAPPVRRTRWGLLAGVGLFAAAAAGAGAVAVRHRLPRVAATPPTAPPAEAAPARVPVAAPAPAAPAIPVPAAPPAPAPSEAAVTAPAAAPEAERSRPASTAKLAASRRSSPRPAGAARGAGARNATLNLEDDDGPAPAPPRERALDFDAKNPYDE